MAKTGRESVQQMLRLTDDLRDRLRGIADENGRSLNAEIIQRLEQSFEHADISARVERLELEKKHMLRWIKLQTEHKKLADSSNYTAKVLLNIFSEMVKSYGEGDASAINEFVKNEKVRPFLADFPMPEPLEDDDENPFE